MDRSEGERGRTCPPLPARDGGKPAVTNRRGVTTSVQAARREQAKRDNPKSKYDPVAQLVEQRPFKAKVRGSSPRWVTKKQHWIFPMLFFDVL